MGRWKEGGLGMTFGCDWRKKRGRGRSDEEDVHGGDESKEEDQKVSLLKSLKVSGFLCLSANRDLTNPKDWGFVSDLLFRWRTCRWDQMNHDTLILFHSPSHNVTLRTLRAKYLVSIMSNYCVCTLHLTLLSLIVGDTYKTPSDLSHHF